MPRDIALTDKLAIKLVKQRKKELERTERELKEATHDGSAQDIRYFTNKRDELQEIFFKSRSESNARLLVFNPLWRLSR